MADGDPAAAVAAAPNALLELRQRLLLERLRDVPHQAISLRRSKYRVIRRIAK